jgi:hypothetical protein
MRRRADSFVNATQILKVAGVDKGRRTKILEKEILPGKHEIVQGGYGKYQGTWSVIWPQSSPSICYNNHPGFHLKEVGKSRSATALLLFFRLYLTSFRLPIRLHLYLRTLTLLLPLVRCPPPRPRHFQA